MGSKVSTLLQPEEVAAIQKETGCNTFEIFSKKIHKFQFDMKQYLNSIFLLLIFN